MNQTPQDNNTNETTAIQPEGTPPAPPKPAMWTASDTWLGLVLLVLIVAGFLFGFAQFETSRTMSMFVVATFEFLLLIPVAIILFWRKVSWTELGLRSFKKNSLALGCGLRVGVYVLEPSAAVSPGSSAQRP